MKKLSKLKLHDVAILSDSEMKSVFGGTGTTGAPEDNKCTHTCGGEESEIICYGECVNLEGGDGVECIENGTSKGKIQCVTTGSR